MIKKCSYLVLILIILCTITCYAVAVPITDENLAEAFQNYTASEDNEENYEILLSEGIITIVNNDISHNMNYNLDDKPTFFLECLIQEGMSYKDFKTKTDAFILPMLGYFAVSNIQGVDFEDARAYFLSSYLDGVLSGGSFSTENSYLIIDDLNLSDGVTIKKNDNPKTIYTSEFGNRVMEYTNNMYAQPLIISDSEGINSYTMTTEKIDISETSCKLISKLEINPDADFATLIGYTDKLAEGSLNKNITKENADLVINLKVGQICKIESDERVTGYSKAGYNCIEIDYEKPEIRGISVGVANGYIYTENSQKSFYATVEENAENTNLDPIILKIESTSDGTNNPEEPETEQEEPKDESKEEQKETTKEEKPKENEDKPKENVQEENPKENMQEEKNKNDNSISSSKLPKAGINYYGTIIFLIAIITTITIGIKLRNLKEV